MRRSCDDGLLLRDRQDTVRSDGLVFAATMATGNETFLSFDLALSEHGR